MRTARVPEDERNIAWLTFHPELRGRLADWVSHARQVVGEVRACGVGLAEDRRY